MKALVIENVLPSIDEIYNFAIETRATFSPIEINYDKVQSDVRICPPGFSGEMLRDRRIRELMRPITALLRSQREELRSRFGFKRPLQLTRSASYFTSMGDGDMLAPHIDRGRYVGSNLEIVFLLYFFREPKQFSGGLLSIYWPEGEEIIEPKQNMLIAFPGWAKHSVSKVSCPSNDVRDYRYAVVGRLAGDLSLKAYFFRGLSKLNTFARHGYQIFTRRQSGSAH